MVPERKELIKVATSHILALFGGTAANYGKSRWGFKEVRYDAQIALFLHHCFPKARFIHLTRNVVDCFISLKQWESIYEPRRWNRKLTEECIDNWKRINASFLTIATTTLPMLHMKYEAIVSNPDRCIEQLSQFLGIEVEQFDPHVFDTHLHQEDIPAGLDSRPKILPSDLTREERTFLSQPDLIALAQAYGYIIQF